jgi:glucose/arabinose dehydrogenase
MEVSVISRFWLKAALLGAALLISVPAQAADVPGMTFKVTPADLPAPFATPATGNSSQAVARPQGELPRVPEGFEVSIVATGLADPRWMALAPNGDVFLAEPGAGKVTLLHDGKPTTFADGFARPHGLAFHDGALYVADTVAVWRLAYKDGALTSGERIRVTTDGFGGANGHSTRDIVFGRDGTLYIAIGSANNIAEEQAPRATVQKVGPGGTLSTFASGLRNPVGIAIYPGTDDLYVTVNERDGYGDGLVPDYLTRIRAGDFFGWPYAYIGNHPDPDFGAKRPDLVAKAKTPDVLFQSHSAPLGLVFYDASQFPADYKGDAFVSLHGSWNSAQPTGYKVVRVKFANGHPTGGYENFLTGFWSGSRDKSGAAQVWGRPAGLLVAKDGSLLVADDVGKTVWRVSYKGK